MACIDSKDCKVFVLLKFVVKMLATGSLERECCGGFFGFILKVVEGKGLDFAGISYRPYMGNMYRHIRLI